MFAEGLEVKRLSERGPGVGAGRGRTVRRAEPPLLGNLEAGTRTVRTATAWPANKQKIQYCTCRRNDYCHTDEEEMVWRFAFAIMPIEELCLFFHWGERNIVRSSSIDIKLHLCQTRRILPGRGLFAWVQTHGHALTAIFIENF